MADNFYAQWFSRTQPRRLTPEELWQRDTDQLRSMATSEFGEFCKERFNIPEVTEAEKIFKAAGKISYAYEILGFCAGHFSQDSRSRAAFF